MLRADLEDPTCDMFAEQLGDGRVVIHLESRWQGGSVAKIFEPADLVAKLVALMPAPGTNLLRFHGHDHARAARILQDVARGRNAKTQNNVDISTSCNRRAVPAANELGFIVTSEFFGRRPKL